jgi:hypothetical protein
LTLPLPRRRLEQISLELAAVGGGYRLSSGELRRRALMLLTQAQELLDRFPE